MEQPQILTHKAITDLLNHQSQAPVATIYLPTHQVVTPSNLNEDQIRCKNLFHKACALLKEQNDKTGLTETLNNSLYHLQQDIKFWENLNKGLLICIQPDKMNMFYLPIDTQEYVAIGESFHLGAVFGLLQEMLQYYVLTIQQHHPVLMRGDIYKLVDSEIELPFSIKAALSIDEMNKKGEQQSSVEGSKGGYNGRGNAKNPITADRLNFWRLIDKIICSKANTDLPLILVGVNSELSEYRDVAHYPFITNGDIRGSYSNGGLHHLFKPAIDIIREEIVKPAQNATIIEYLRIRGQTPNHAIDQLASIRSASDEGRIDKLLLADVRNTTDTIGNKIDSVPVLSFPDSSLAEVINEVAYKVWSRGGEVANFETDEMPEPGALMLATLRY